MSADHELPSRDLTQLLHSQERVAQMVEYTEEHDDIEVPDPLRGHVRHIQNGILHIQLKRPSGEIKGFLLAPAFANPAVMISGQHTSGAAFLSLKAVRAIPGADIQN